MLAKTYFESGDHRVATLANVVISINLEPPTAEGTGVVVDAVRTLHETRGEKVRLVLVPAANRPNLSVAASRAISQAWPDVEPRLERGAVWIRRQGFVAAAARSLITGVMLLRPDSSIPIKVSNDPKVVSAFIAANSTAGMDPGSLNTALFELCEGFVSE